MIQVEALSKKYGDKYALRPVSVHVQKGKTLSVVGLSGCGKTTFLRCIAGLIKDYTGEVRLSGVEHGVYLSNHRVGMVFQKYSNFQWLSAFENLLEAFAVTGKDDNAYHECEEMLRSLGLEEARDMFVSELSGGMQQRIALGRALLQKQDIIGMDEPFAALDVKNRRAMQDLVKLIFHKEERTAIFVTHDLTEAIYVGDEILVLPNSSDETPKVFQSVDSEVVAQGIKTSSDFLRLKSEITDAIVSMN